MAALPARKIRSVETDASETRPRDAAIRNASLQRNNDRRQYSNNTIRGVKTAANDNNPLRYASNDNTQSGYPTVSQDFDQYATGRTTQATVSQFRKQNPNQTRRAKTKSGPFSRGGTPQSRVRSMDNSLEARGWLQKIESNLEEVDFDDLEDFFNQYGDALNEKTRGIIGKALLARKYYKVSMLNRSIIMAGMSFWWSIQLPIAIAGVVFLGMAYIINGVIPEIIKETTGEIIYGAISFVYNTFSEGVSWLLNEIFGVDLSAIVDPTNYFVLANSLVFLIGLSTLIIMGIVYQISFINCVFGKGAALKIRMLLLAVFGYMVPVFNILPWFIFWLLAVWRYPK